MARVFLLFSYLIPSGLLLELVNGCVWGSM